MSRIVYFDLNLLINTLLFIHIINYQIIYLQRRQNIKIFDPFKTRFTLKRTF